MFLIKQAEIMLKKELTKDNNEFFRDWRVRCYVPCTLACLVSCITLNGRKIKHLMTADLHQNS